MKSSGLFLCLLFLFPPSGVADDIPRLVGTVTRIVDGDTIDVKLSSGPIRIRLHGIDTPEKGQPWGKEASAALSHLVLNRQVEIEPFEQDRYERLIGRVYVGETDINGELVKQGHAWAFRQYMTKADARYCTFEQGARKAKRGLWTAKAEETLPPWSWRSLQKAKAPRPYFTVEQFSEGTCIDQIGKKLRVLKPTAVLVD